MTLRQRARQALGTAAIGLIAAGAARAEPTIDLKVEVVPKGSAAVALHQTGTLDWVHWGLGQGAGPFDKAAPPKEVRKAGANLIERFGYLTTARTEPAFWGGVTITDWRFAWRDGTPQPIGNEVKEGILVRLGLSAANRGTGFVFAVKSAPKPRVLTVYLGCQGVDARIDAVFDRRPTAAPIEKVVMGRSVCDLEPAGADLVPEVKATVTFTADDYTPLELGVRVHDHYLSNGGVALFAAALAGEPDLRDRADAGADAGRADAADGAREAAAIETATDLEEAGASDAMDAEAPPREPARDAAPRPVDGVVARPVPRPENPLACAFGARPVAPGGLLLLALLLVGARAARPGGRR